MSVKVKVDQGEVVVNRILQVVGEPDSYVQVFEVDCASKYARPLQALGERDCELMLFADEHTRSVREAARGRPTRIEFSGLYPNTSMIVDGGRYTWRVVLYVEDSAHHAERYQA